MLLLVLSLCIRIKYRLSQIIKFSEERHPIRTVYACKRVKFGGFPLQHTERLQEQ